MSIVPSGKRREQVAQGGCRSASIFESDMFAPIAKKYAQGMELKQDQSKPNKPANPKDLKMNELQQTLNESNTLPQEKEKTPLDQPQQHSDGSGMDGSGSEFIDISKRISQKVIDALGLSSRPGEHWAGKTEISNDGDEVIGITIKLTRAEPKDMMMQTKVEKGGEPLGAPLKGNGPPGAITNSV